MCEAEFCSSMDGQRHRLRRNAFLLIVSDPTDGISVAPQSPGRGYGRRAGQQRQQGDAAAVFDGLQPVQQRRISCQSSFLEQCNNLGQRRGHDQTVASKDISGISTQFPPFGGIPQRGNAGGSVRVETGGQMFSDPTDTGGTDIAGLIVSFQIAGGGVKSLRPLPCYPGFNPAGEFLPEALVPGGKILRTIIENAFSHFRMAEPPARQPPPEPPTLVKHSNADTRIMQFASRHQPGQAASDDQTMMRFFRMHGIYLKAVF